MKQIELDLKFVLNAVHEKDPNLLEELIRQHLISYLDALTKFDCQMYEEYPTIHVDVSDDGNDDCNQYKIIDIR